MAKNLLHSIFNTQDRLSKDELQAYMDDSAGPDVRHKVENAMLDDPLYADAVEGYREMGLRKMPALESFDDFKKKLPRQHEDTRVVQFTPVRAIFRYAAVAAALLLLVAGYFLLKDPSPASLYASFYTHYENDISLTRRGDADGLQPDFKSALRNYSTRSFEAALTDFDKALAAEPDNDAAHFFAGLACLEEGITDKAVAHLGKVRNGQGIYSRKAFWYEILATIKAGDMATARQMLDEFVQSPGYKEQEARELLAELE